MDLKPECLTSEVPVVPASPSIYEAARQLADKFCLPIAEKTTATSYLKLTDTGLALWDKRFKPIQIDFINGKLGYRRQHGGGRNQALGRAIGLKKGAKPFVIDATAGLGKDAFVLTCLGCQVAMLERSPVLSALLYIGLQQAQQHTEIGKLVTTSLQLIHTSAQRWLSQLTLPQFPDVIYLDPMYPLRRKSALVKKEMQVLKEMVGSDEDAPDLLQVALQKAKKRVVVERPKHASYLGEVVPSTHIHSQNTRYDIYLLGL